MRQVNRNSKGCNAIGWWFPWPVFRDVFYMLLKNGLVLAVFDLLKLAKISCFYGLKFLSDRCLPKHPRIMPHATVDQRPLNSISRRKRLLSCNLSDGTQNNVTHTRKRTRFSELSEGPKRYRISLRNSNIRVPNAAATTTARVRTRSYFKSNGVDRRHLKLDPSLASNSPSTPNIRARLRSFNGSYSPPNHFNRIATMTSPKENVPTNGSSDEENQVAFDKSFVEKDKALQVELTPIFSPRRFRSPSKDQAAKLKRVNARRIEFDVEEVVENSDLSSSYAHEESFLSQSIVGDPKEKLLELCGQTETRSFSSFFDAETLESIVKIGEGVYGEVFQTHKGTVIKVFPVDGDLPVNGEKQMESSRVYPEVFISRQLTELGFKYRQNRSVNFIQLRKASLVCGKWPSEFTSAWKKYEAEHGSDNECLDFLPRCQEWMILEFDYAGKPLGTVKFNSYREARSVIQQIAISLAAAESALQFEHRDLHWLNVLVKPTKQEKLRYRVGGVSYAVQTEGIHVCIIDFTVSRLCHEGNIVYVDMSKSPEVFECEGDYQFDIYRMMRDMNGNNWRPFRPITNLYWLNYLMDKLLNQTSYPRRDPDSSAIESELAALRDTVLSGSYRSATQLVNLSFYFDSCRID